MKRMPPTLPPSFPGDLAGFAEIEEQISESGAQNLEQRLHTYMVSIPCSASQPGPGEAKSPAQRHPHDQTGKPRRTGLPHPLPASLLPSPVPGAGTSWEVLTPLCWVCKKALKHVTSRSSQLPQPLEGKDKVSPIPFYRQTDKKR